MEAPKGTRQNENGRNSHAFGDSKSRCTRMDLPLRRLGGFHRLCRLEGWVLYSVEAGLLGEGKDCPQCGGRLELAKKGIFQCQPCGAEVFLKK
jgi:ribosomal protein S27AE